MHNLVTLALLLHLLMDDIHFIHFNCRGREFKTIHELAKEYYDALYDQYDDMVELCMSYGLNVPNPIHAAQVLNYRPLDASSPYDYRNSILAMKSRIDNLVGCLYSTHEQCDDINAKIYIEDLIRHWHKQSNYVLAHMLDEIAETPMDTGDSLLERMPEDIFDAFRDIYDTKGSGACQRFLSGVYPGKARAIIISFRRKNNFANDNEDIDAKLQKELEKLDEKVLNEVVEFVKDPTEDAMKKLSDEARKFLEGLDEEMLNRLQELAKGEGEGGEGEGDSNGNGGGNNDELDAKLQEELGKLDEKVLNEVVEFIKNPTEEALGKLSDEARKFLEGLDEQLLNRLQELVNGEGGDGDGGDQKPADEEMLAKVRDLSPEELEELRFILFDPNGKDGSGKDPEITKKMQELIKEVGPENLDRLKAAVSDNPSEDPNTPRDGEDNPPQDVENPDPNSYSPKDGDLLDRFATLDDDTINELRSILKIGKGTGTNVKIEREVIEELSRMSEERVNMLTKKVDEKGDGLPHENREEYEAPVQDPNKAPTNLQPDYQKSQIIMQDPSNYRLDSVPGGRVSDPTAAQYAMNQENQKKIQAFSNPWAYPYFPRYNFNVPYMLDYPGAYGYYGIPENFSNFSSIADVYSQIETCLGEELPKDILDDMIAAYEQFGEPGLANVLSDRQLPMDQISQLGYIISQKDPQENFRASFSNPYPYGY